MTQTTSPKPYHVQAKLSQDAKKALRQEKARRLLDGQDISVKDIAAEVIESWAKSST